VRTQQSAQSISNYGDADSVEEILGFETNDAGATPEYSEDDDVVEIGVGNGRGGLPNDDIDDDHDSVIEIGPKKQ